MKKSSRKRQILDELKENIGMTKEADSAMSDDVMKLLEEKDNNPKSNLQLQELMWSNQSNDCMGMLKNTLLTKKFEAMKQISKKKGMFNTMILVKTLS